MNKLPKNTYPVGHGTQDFECSGPPALVDGDFSECKIADLGCFDQSGRDTNKYYHGAIVRSKRDNGIWVYFEWGRTGAGKPAFQFFGCRDDHEARKIFSKQLHDKNDKRGQWITVGSMKTLQAKPDEDCYLVRPMATRSTGLADARTIRSNEGIKKTSNGSVRRVDDHTISLLRDLSLATVAYAKGVTADAAIPTQKAMDEARIILKEAAKRIAVVQTLEEQQNDKELLQYTMYLYGKIPKKKPRHGGPETWVLHENNILAWLNDLDAFESALYSTEHHAENDPLAGLPIHMEWIDPKTKIGTFIYDWWPNATNHRHSYLGGNMMIKNVWKIERSGESLASAQKKVIGSEISVRPQFQKDRPELDASTSKLFKNSNTAMLFHGSRSVNIGGILQKNFRLPKELANVHMTGALFGGGVYFADDWKKSAGYTSVPRAFYTQGEGSIPGRSAFMFAVDVVLGNPYVAAKSYGYEGPPHQHHSVMGKGNFSTYKDRYGVTQILQNNEYVIYDVNQQNIRYLAEFAVGG